MTVVLFVSLAAAIALITKRMNVPIKEVRTRMAKVEFDNGTMALTIENCLEYYNKLGLATIFDEGKKATFEFEA